MFDYFHQISNTMDALLTKLMTHDNKKVKLNFLSNKRIYLKWSNY